MNLVKKEPSVYLLLTKLTLAYYETSLGGENTITLSNSELKALLTHVSCDIAAE